MADTRGGTAIHEIGHLIVGACSNPSDRFYTMRVRQQDGRGGYVKYYLNDGELEEYRLFTIAGAIAEIMDKGVTTSLYGSKRDLRDYYHAGGKRLRFDAATLDDTAAEVADTIKVNLEDVAECVRRLRKNWKLAKHFQNLVYNEGRVQFNTQETQALAAAVNK